MISQRDPKIPLIRYARELRKNPTPAEKIIWEFLRNRQMKGYKFRRQYPVESFILDFYCPKLKLAIEIDGGYHQECEQQKLDPFRERLIRDYDIRIIRFTIDQILGNIDSVLDEIRTACISPPLRATRGEGAGGEV